MPGAKFVHRVHTLAELADPKSCVVCERPASLSRPADYGQGAAPLYLTAPLPPLRLCDRCAGEQSDAMRFGRRAVLAAMVAPVLVVLLVAALAPFRAPVVVPAAGFLALLGSRAVVAYVRRRRARGSRVLFVDGVGEETLLQIRLDEARADAAPYREESRIARTDGLVTEPVGPRVRATLAFVLSTLAVSVLAIVGFVGSYPSLTIDNPGVSVRASVDGTPFVLGDASRELRVGYGRHRVVLDGVVHDVRVPWGENVLVSTNALQCYWLREERAGGATARIVPGPIVVFAAREHAARARCTPNP